MAIANSQIHANILNQIAFLLNTWMRLVSLKEGNFGLWWCWEVRGAEGKDRRKKGN